MYFLCSDYALVSLAEAESFMERCMVAVGAKKSHAKDLATLLVCADYRGHYSHGMNRLSKSSAQILVINLYVYTFFYSARCII